MRRVLQLRTCILADFPASSLTKKFQQTETDQPASHSSIILSSTMTSAIKFARGARRNAPRPSSISDSPTPAIPALHRHELLTAVEADPDRSIGSVFKAVGRKMAKGRTSTSAPTRRWGDLLGHRAWTRRDPAESSPSSPAEQPVTPAPLPRSRVQRTRRDESSAGSSSSIVSGDISQDLLFSPLPQGPSVSRGDDEILREMKAMRESQAREMKAMRESQARADGE